MAVAIVAWCSVGPTASAQDLHVRKKGVTHPADTVPGRKKNKTLASPRAQQTQAKELYYNSRNASARPAPPVITPYVVGGTTTQIEAVPWQVFVMTSDFYVGGGSVLNEYWVVTAAHVGLQAGDSIFAGISDLTKRRQGQTRQIAEAVYHPFWNNLPWEGHDICLLRVSVPFDLSGPRVQPIAYATPADEAAGLTDPCVVGLVSGFGTLRSGAEGISAMLQSVWMPILSHPLADAAYVGWNGFQPGWMTDDQLSAGDYALQECRSGEHDGGEDVCQGDSGGPLVVLNAAGTGYLLAGITSWGNGCADPDYPGFFCKVAAVASFIEETTGIHPATAPGATAQVDVALVNLTGITPGQVVTGCGGEAIINPGIVIRNNGTKSLSSLAVDIQFNGGHAPYTATINPVLLPGEYATLLLPELAVTSAASLAYGVAIVDVRDEVTSNNTLQAIPFTTVISDAAQHFTVRTATDLYSPRENSWQVLDANNNVVVGSTTMNSHNYHKQSFCLDNGTYTFVLTDTFGDGIYENGGVEVFLADGTRLIYIDGFDAVFDNFCSQTGCPEPSLRTVSRTFTVPFAPVTSLTASFVTPVNDYHYTHCSNTFYSGKVRLTNTGNVPVTSAVLKYGVGTATTELVQRGILIQPGGTWEVALPALTLAAGANTLVAEVASVNAVANADVPASRGTVKVTLTLDAHPNHVTVRFKTDSYPEENTWYIVNPDGIVMAQGSGYGAWEVNTIDVCLPDGNYAVGISDLAGDGIDPWIENPLVVLSDGHDVIVFFPTLWADANFNLGFSLPANLTTNIAVALLSPTETVTSCNALVPLKVRLTNTGTSPVLEMGAEYTVNEMTNTAELSGILNPGKSTVVDLGLVTMAEGDNTITVGIPTVLGEPDDVLDDNTATSVVAFHKDKETSMVQVDLTFDSRPDQTRWQLLTEAGEVLEETGGYTVDDDYYGNTTVYRCLPVGCYDLALLDAAGNGGAGARIQVNGTTYQTLAYGANWGARKLLRFCTGEDAVYPVTNLKATRLAATEADLQWEYEYEADHYIVYRSLTGKDGSYVAAGEAMDNNFTLTDLTPQTNYYFAVAAVHNAIRSPLATLLGATIPRIGGTGLFEGFEGDDFPSTGWQMVSRHEDEYSAWSHRFSSYYDTANVVSGLRCAVSYTYYFPDIDDWIISPPITIQESDSLYYHVKSGSPDEVRQNYSIMVSTTDGSFDSFTTLYKGALANNFWKADKFSLADYAGQTVYLAFRNHDVAGLEGQLWFDDIIVGILQEGAAPVVQAPVGFTATAASYHQVDLRWKADATPDAFELYMSTTGEPESFEKVEVLAGAARSFTLAGLETSMPYYFKLAARVGSQYSADATATARTSPYSLVESFESRLFPPEGWLMLDEDGDHHSWTQASQGEEFNAIDGRRVARCLTSNLPRADNWLVSPAVTIRPQDSLYFYVKAYDDEAHREFYAIGISTTDRAPGSFTDVFSETLQNSAWQARAVDLSAYVGQRIYISIRHYTPVTEYGLLLDNILVGNAAMSLESLETPEPLSIVQFSDSRVKLGWVDAIIDEEGFRVQVATDQLGPWSTAKETTANTTTTIVDGLEKNTTYFFRAQSFVAAGTSAWSNVVSVTTLVTGLEETLADAVAVYPNPATTGTVQIKLTGVLAASPSYDVQITDVRGLPVAAFHDVRQTGGEVFPLGQLRKGVYILRIDTRRGRVAKKLVIE
jgi:hypothetical protein